MENQNDSKITQDGLSGKDVLIYFLLIVLMVIFGLWYLQDSPAMRAFKVCFKKKRNHILCEQMVDQYFDDSPQPVRARPVKVPKSLVPQSPFPSETPTPPQTQLEKWEEEPTALDKAVDPPPLTPERTTEHDNGAIPGRTL